MLSHLYFRVYISTEHVRDSGKSNYTKEKKEVKATQSCLTLCDPMAYEVDGILQARILEWIAFPFSRGSSQPRDRTQVSYIAGILYQLSHKGTYLWPKLQLPNRINLQGF